MSGSRFSLFFLKKKTFKSFIKESKQDLYSSKNLLDRAFSFIVDDKEKIHKNYSNYFLSHIIFCSSFALKNKVMKILFCIHCGMVADSL